MPVTSVPCPKRVLLSVIHNAVTPVSAATARHHHPSPSSTTLLSYPISRPAFRTNRIPGHRITKATASQSISPRITRPRPPRLFRHRCDGRWERRWGVLDSGVREGGIFFGGGDRIVWPFGGLCSWKQGDGFILRCSDLNLICVWRVRGFAGTGWWDGWHAWWGWVGGVEFRLGSRLNFCR